MKTTKNKNDIPRVLVRLSNESKMLLVEKDIITTSGEKVTLCLKAPSYLEVDKYELSVKTGEVIGLSPGVIGIEIGDLALIDYIVDADAEFVVMMDGKDKIVSVPCQSKYYEKDLMATSYYVDVSEATPENPYPEPILEYTGEKNVYVAKKGDVKHIPLVLAIVKNGTIIPDEYFVFCEPIQHTSGFVIQSNGMFGYAKKETTHIRRKVVFSNPKSKYKAGDWILAILESNFEHQLFDKKFDVIPVVDILAID